MIDPPSSEQQQNENGGSGRHRLSKRRKIGDLGSGGARASKKNNSPQKTPPHTIKTPPEDEVNDALTSSYNDYEKSSSNSWKNDNMTSLSAKNADEGDDRGAKDVHDQQQPQHQERPTTLRSTSSSTGGGAPAYRTKEGDIRSHMGLPAAFLSSSRGATGTITSTTAAATSSSTAGGTTAPSGSTTTTLHTDSATTTKPGEAAQQEPKGLSAVFSSSFSSFSLADPPAGGDTTTAAAGGGGSSRSTTSSTTAAGAAQDDNTTTTNAARRTSNRNYRVGGDVPLGGAEIVVGVATQSSSTVESGTIHDDQKPSHHDHLSTLAVASILVSERRRRVQDDPLQPETNRQEDSSSRKGRENSEGGARTTTASENTSASFTVKNHCAALSPMTCSLNPIECHVSRSTPREETVPIETKPGGFFSSSEGHSFTNPITTSRGLIMVPGPNDILMGRGRPFQNYIGNRKMVAIVDKHKDAYNATPRQERRPVGEAILDEVLKTGARFLRKVEIPPPPNKYDKESSQSKLLDSTASPPPVAASHDVDFVVASSLQMGASTSSDDAGTIPSGPWEEVPRQVAFDKVTHVIRGKRRIRKMDTAIKKKNKKHEALDDHGSNDIFSKQEASSGLSNNTIMNANEVYSVAGAAAVDGGFQRGDGYGNISAGPGGSSDTAAAHGPRISSVSSTAGAERGGDIPVVAGQEHDVAALERFILSTISWSLGVALNKQEVREGGGRCATGDTTNNGSVLGVQERGGGDLPPQHSVKGFAVNSPGQLAGSRSNTGGLLDQIVTAALRRRGGLQATGESWEQTAPSAAARQQREETPRRQQRKLDDGGGRELLQVPPPFRDNTTNHKSNWPLVAEAAEARASSSSLSPQDAAAAVQDLMRALLTSNRLPGPQESSQLLTLLQRLLVTAQGGRKQAGISTQQNQPKQNDYDRSSLQNAPETRGGPRSGGSGLAAVVATSSMNEAMDFSSSSTPAAAAAAAGTSSQEHNNSKNSQRDDQSTRRLAQKEAQVSELLMLLSSLRQYNWENEILDHNVPYDQQGNPQSQQQSRVVLPSNSTDTSKRPFLWWDTAAASSSPSSACGNILLGALGNQMLFQQQTVRGAAMPPPQHAPHSPHHAGAANLTATLLVNQYAQPPVKRAAATTRTSFSTTTTTRYQHQEQAPQQHQHDPPAPQNNDLLRQALLEYLVQQQAANNKNKKNNSGGGGS